jgi:hypothetical protein
MSKVIQSWPLGGARFTFPRLAQKEVNGVVWRPEGAPERSTVLATRQTHADYMAALAAPAFAKAFTPKGKLRAGWRMIGAVPTYVR